MRIILVQQKVRFKRLIFAREEFWHIVDVNIFCEVSYYVDVARGGQKTLHLTQELSAGSAPLANVASAMFSMVETRMTLHI